MTIASKVIKIIIILATISATTKKERKNIKTKHKQKGICLLWFDPPNSTVCILIKIIIFRMRKVPMTFIETRFLNNVSESL